MAREAFTAAPKPSQPTAEQIAAYEKGGQAPTGRLVWRNPNSGSAWIFRRAFTDVSRLPAQPAAARWGANCWQWSRTGHWSWNRK